MKKGQRTRQKILILIGRFQFVEGFQLIDFNFYNEKYGNKYVLL